MTAPNRRILKLQRQIHKAVRADVRRVLGRQSKDIRSYYEAYKREFRNSGRVSSKDELIENCLEAQIILMGDYHTFPQSQKAALRLLRELINNEKQLTLALEMFHSEDQKVINAYLNDELNENEFLSRVDYEKKWGFPWSQFAPILNLAKEKKIPVIGLNCSHELLEVRDAHAAELIADYTKAHPRRGVFVLYGDLHLARGHIPYFLRAELKENKIKRKTLTIFQNSESLYWRLADQGKTHSVEVMNLGENRFCIMNAAPWVKLQSYIEWTESNLDEAGEDDSVSHVFESCLERIKNLEEALGLKLSNEFTGSVFTSDDLSFLQTSEKVKLLSRQEAKALRYHVYGNRNCFIPSQGVLYLSSVSINSLSESAALILHSDLTNEKEFYTNPSSDVYAAIIRAAIGYFGSKLINHKRKCALESDFERALKIKLSKSSLPQEKIQKRVAKYSLAFCSAEKEFIKTQKYRLPRTLKGASNVPIFYEATRCVGAILGERIYNGFISGVVSLDLVQTLFKSSLTSKQKSRKILLELYSALKKSALSHESKDDLF